MDCLLLPPVIHHTSKYSWRHLANRHKTAKIAAKAFSLEILPLYSSIYINPYRCVSRCCLLQAPKLEEALSKYFGPPQAVAEEEEGERELWRSDKIINITFIIHSRKCL